MVMGYDGVGDFTAATDGAVTAIRMHWRITEVTVVSGPHKVRPIYKILSKYESDLR
jgi:hypothetical protein